MGSSDGTLSGKAMSSNPPRPRGPVALSESTSRVLAYARDEAQRLRNNYIGPEHVFYGILRERDGLAARVLEGHNIDAGRLSTLLEARTGTSEASAQPEMMPRTKKVLELAAVDAAQRGVPVGPEHVLLGLIRESELDGVLVDVFGHFNVNREFVRRATVAAIESRQG